MTRIRAFTIIELVVVMIITSFIFIAGYFAYSSTIARMHYFESKSSQNVELAQLNFLLNKDFKEATTAALTSPVELTLIKPFGNTTTYQFEDIFTIRKTNIVCDTFNVKATKLTGITLASDQAFISGLNIEIESGAKDFTLTFEKEYDPFFFLNHNQP